MCSRSAEESDEMISNSEKQLLFIMKQNPPSLLFSHVFLSGLASNGRAKSPIPHTLQQHFGINK